MENTEVWRMRRSFPKEFHCLVKMHLSFLLDLSTDDCDCSFVYDTACPASPPSHKHKSSDVARMFFPTPRKSSTSGVQAFKGVMEGLPLTMEGVCQIFQLIHFLSRSQEHLRVEGLFRKHGNLKKQQALRERLNRGIAIDLEEGEFTVHEVASVLKTFLSELPEPLLTDACYRAHCQVGLMTDKQKQIHALQLLFLLIPDSHYQLLKDTLFLLHSTAAEESYNKMSASNLATVFATHLLCPRKLSAEILQSNHQLFIKSVTLMVEEAHRLFESAPTKLSEDVAAHFRRQEVESSKGFRRQDEDTSKLLDRPPQFSSVHRVQTRRQAILQRSHSLDVPESPTSRMQSPVVNTIFSFVDRKTTRALNEKSTTATELAKLYAHVQSMPESAQKKKLVQKLNDANGIGTPGRKIRTKTQKTKNQLKNLLTPRTVKSSKREIPALGDEKKGWHANSYNVAQVVTSEQKPPTSAMMTFKRRSSEDRQIASTSTAVVASNVETPSKGVDTIDYLMVDFCPRKTLGFDVEDDDDGDEEDVKGDESGDAEEEPQESPIKSKDDNDIQNSENMSSKKLPPPPVPPRISSLCPPPIPSPLSQKIAASRELDPSVLSTPRNRKPLILISNSTLPTPEIEPVKKDTPGRWDSGYLSQKLDDPIYPSPTKDTLNLPSPIKDDRTTSEVVDVDEELERMEKEEFEKSVRSLGGDDSDWPTPPKMLRLSNPNDSVASTSTANDENNDSVTSSIIREEADQLLRGDLDPSDSMCAFLDGEVVLKQDLMTTPDHHQPDRTPNRSSKMGRKRRSITELGGPNPMAKTSTPTGIYFETDL